MSKPKGWLARESYRVLQGPLVFLLPTGPPSSVLRSWPRQGPSIAWRKFTFLAFPKEGAPSGTAGITELHLSEM